MRTCNCAKKLNQLLLLILVSAAIFVGTAADISTNTGVTAAILDRYTGNDNAIERRYALTDLGKSFTYRAVPEWAQTLLVTALGDRDPVVVEEAVFQIGNFKLAENNSRLIMMYNNAEQLFGGYSLRLRYAIIETLGKNGGLGVKEFLVNELANDNGTDFGGSLLTAVIDLNDATLVSDVEKYSLTLSSLIAQMKKDNVDPIFYWQREQYVKRCLDIKQSLVAKGGK